MQSELPTVLNVFDADYQLEYSESYSGNVHRLTNAKLPCRGRGSVTSVKSCGLFLFFFIYSQLFAKFVMSLRVQYRPVGCYC